MVFGNPYYETHWKGWQFYEMNLHTRVFLQGWISKKVSLYIICNTFTTYMLFFCIGQTCCTRILSLSLNVMLPIDLNLSGSSNRGYWQLACILPGLLEGHRGCSIEEIALLDEDRDWKWPV